MVNDADDDEQIAALFSASVANIPKPALNTHTPRNYQRYIFEIAKTQNTIVVLPTGTGKTLISLLLIKHMASVDAERNLATPKVPLVSQQVNYLRHNCDFEVRSYHGDLGVDNYTEQMWQSEISATGCMVMTPAILSTILTRGFLRMSQINLIVFDECHNARKNDVYNQIIALHYLPTLPSERPLIFGMTASPMSGKDEINTSIKQLEVNLACKAITPDSHSDLKYFTVNPGKSIVRYKPCNDESRLLLLLIQMGVKEIPKLKRVCNDTQSLCEDFGGWIGDAFLKASIIGQYINRGKCVGNESFGADVVESAQVDDEMEEGEITESVASVSIAKPTSSKDFVVDNTSFESPLRYETKFESEAKAKEENSRYEEFLKSATQIILSRWKKQIDDTIDAFEPPSTEEPYPTEEMKAFSLKADTPIPESLYTKMSSKFLELVKVLESYKTDDGFCGIVFVEKRCTSKIMAILLPRCAELRGFLKSDSLVGHSSGKTGAKTAADISMGTARQQNIVFDFRDGKLNLLVATK
ncbi:Endoribonuclease Dicer, partial [Physocladia obscura]